MCLGDVHSKIQNHCVAWNITVYFFFNGYQYSVTAS